MDNNTSCKYVCTLDQDRKATMDKDLQFHRRHDMNNGQLSGCIRPYRRKGRGM